MIRSFRWSSLKGVHDEAEPDKANGSVLDAIVRAISGIRMSAAADKGHGS